MRYNSVLLLFLLSLLSFGGCSSTEKAAKKEEPQNPPPNWVTNRPTSSAHYIGIGISDKKAHPLDYARDAKRNALNELASEIEVNITSKSMLYSTENSRGEFKDEYKSFIKVSTDRTIEDYEQVDSYETEDKYYVYYRLSKAKYQSNRKAAIEKAIDASKGFYSTALQERKENNYSASLENALRAVNSIEPFIGEDLITTYDGEQVYWGNHLKTFMSNTLREIKIKANIETTSARWSIPLSEDDVSFTVLTENGEKLQNIPIEIEYSEGFIRPKLTPTNSNGVAKANLVRIVDQEPNQWLSAKLAIGQIHQNAIGQKPDVVFEQLIKSLNIPSVRKKIEVSSPQVYLDVNIQNDQQREFDEMIKKAIRNRLSYREMQEASSKQNADYIIRVTADYRMLEKKMDMYRAQISGNFEVERIGDNSIVFSENISGLLGVQLSEKNAVFNGFEKLSSEIEEKVFPKFYRQISKD
ncbi:LPP20 family lipoprotein [Salibacter halophilus]|uniref:Lipoprotein LPP20-like domain-containing protein n=1 Tax=Salibacter halophilus TaxID=1803916 RepID=A0A6N6M8U1_9FLAO|nr:LPP20 family lipoprotein [Salibacter halophilus]KAB1065184.1 hypothetical protein F3059_04315 [Salibacter halophilus]